MLNCCYIGLLQAELKWDFLRSFAGTLIFVIVVSGIFLGFCGFDEKRKEIICMASEKKLKLSINVWF